jgi:hypothetical protein
MNLKTTYGMLLLTAIALLIAPQIAKTGLIKQSLPFLLYLIPCLWFTLLIKNINNPG